MRTSDRCLGLLLGVSLISTGLSQEKPPSPKPPLQTFAVEAFVGRTYNYWDNMVDEDGALDFWFLR